MHQIQSEEAFQKAQDEMSAHMDRAQRLNDLLRSAETWCTDEELAQVEAMLRTLLSSALARGTARRSPGLMLGRIG